MKRIQTKSTFVLPIMVVIAMFFGVSGAQMTSHGESVNSSEETLPSGLGLEGVKILPIDEQPIPQEAKELAKKMNYEMLTKGYVDASDEEVRHIEKYKDPKHRDEVEPMETIASKIKFRPAVLQSPRFIKAKLEGAVSHGVLDGEQWNMLTRIFTMSDGSIVELEEWDYASSGGGALVTKEMINQSVNGNPAVLIVRKSPAGKKLTELAWYTERKGYVLRASVDAGKKEALEDLLDIARSISD
ncbi:MAG: hypothetical protein M1497_05190 [Nitrospirae bacterium]|nr:hypothetical protein [Nitrospirota bacterium]